MKVEKIRGEAVLVGEYEKILTGSLEDVKRALIADYATEGDLLREDKHGILRFDESEMALKAGATETGEEEVKIYSKPRVEFRLITMPKGTKVKVRSITPPPEMVAWLINSLPTAKLAKTLEPMVKEIEPQQEASMQRYFAKIQEAVKNLGKGL